MNEMEGSPEPCSASAGDGPGVVDRTGPTRRPDRRSVMRQTWKELLFLHWTLAPEQIRPLLPPQLELDLFEGKAYVGLVPFSMTGVRPTVAPALAGLSSFHETNVRTYVLDRGGNPGVWFFSLDAANSVAVRLARRLFHLPYHRADMFLERERPGALLEPGPVLYAGVRRWPGPVPASYLIRAEVTGPVAPAVLGTIEHFLAERYLLYTCFGNQLYRGQVYHSPYPLQTARVLTLDENLLAASGIERPCSQPIAHYAAGVDVLVYALQRP